MEIQYHKDFLKRFEKLDEKHKNKVVKTIERFSKNPLEQSLKNHQLKGALRHFRAISVTGNMRIIFEQFDNYTLVVMLDVGTHNQVY